MCNVEDASVSPAGGYVYVFGYTFARYFSIQTGESYLGPRPALKKLRKLCREISEVTDRRTCHRDTVEEVRTLNQKSWGRIERIAFVGLDALVEIAFHVGMAALAVPW